MDKPTVMFTVGPKTEIRRDGPNLLFRSDDPMGLWVTVTIRDAGTWHRIEGCAKDGREAAAGADPLTLPEVAA